MSNSEQAAHVHNTNFDFDFSSISLEHFPDEISNNQT